MNPVDTLDRLRRTLCDDADRWGPILTTTEHNCMMILRTGLDYQASLRDALKQAGDDSPEVARKAEQDPSWRADGWKWLKRLKRLAPELDRRTVEAHWLTRFGVLPSDAGVLNADRQRYYELIAAGTYSADLGLSIPAAREQWREFAPRDVA